MENGPCFFERYDFLLAFGSSVLLNAARLQLLHGAAILGCDLLLDLHFFDFGREFFVELGDISL